VGGLGGSAPQHYDDRPGEGGAATEQVQPEVVDPTRAYSNIKAQVRQLEELITKLPSLDAPVQVSAERPMPRRIKRLTEAQTQELVEGYEAGKTVYELGEEFGIARQTVGKILKDRKSVV
jgi:response regulator of citrate/malate metabolism